MVVFTQHAIEKMDALGIERQDVLQTIARGMKWLSFDRWHAHMAGIEVVFVKQEDTVVIITVYLAGSIK